MEFPSSIDIKQKDIVHIREKIVGNGGTVRSNDMEWWIIIVDFLHYSYPFQFLPFLVGKCRSIFFGEIKIIVV